MSQESLLDERAEVAEAQEVQPTEVVSAGSKPRAKGKSETPRPSKGGAPRRMDQIKKLREQERDILEGKTVAKVRARLAKLERDEALANSGLDAGARKYLEADIKTAGDDPKKLAALREKLKATGIIDGRKNLRVIVPDPAPPVPLDRLPSLVGVLYKYAANGADPRRAIGKLRQQLVESEVVSPEEAVRLCPDPKKDAA